MILKDMSLKRVSIFLKTFLSPPIITQAPLRAPPGPHPSALLHPAMTVMAYALLRDLGYKTAFKRLWRGMGNIV